MRSFFSNKLSGIPPENILMVDVAHRMISIFDITSSFQTEFIGMMFFSDQLLSCIPLSHVLLESFPDGGACIKMMNQVLAKSSNFTTQYSLLVWNMLEQLH